MNDMALPAGKTCADCRHLKRCVGMGFTEQQNTTCDFSPSRFMDSSETSTFTSRLRQALRVAGLDAGQLDRLMRWPQGTTRDFLAGRGPSIAELHTGELAEVLQVHPPWLAFGTRSADAERMIQRLDTKRGIPDEDLAKVIEVFETM